GLVTCADAVEGVVQIEVSLGDFRPGERLGDGSRRFHTTCRVRTVSTSRKDCEGKRLRSRIREVRTAFVRVGSDATTIGGNDRQTRRHRFERCDPERLRWIGMHKEITTRIESRKLLAIRDVTQKHYLARKSFLSVPSK